MNSRVGGIPAYIMFLAVCAVLVLYFGLWLRTANGLCWTVHHGIESASYSAAFELSLSHDPRAIHCLLAALGDQDPSTRNNALSGLARRSDLNLLIEAASTSNPLPRAQVFPLLAFMGDRAPDRLTPLFTSALSDPQPIVCLAAAEGLRRIGSPASGSLPFLLPLVADPDPKVRDATVHALARIGGAPALREAMKNQMPVAQLAIIRYLSYQYGEGDSPIEELLPEISAAAGNYSDPEVSILAQQILRRMQAAQKAAGSTLR
jgi:HEAT repeat protein